MEPPPLCEKGGNIQMARRVGQSENLESRYKIVRPENHLHLSAVSSMPWNFRHLEEILELSRQKLLKAAVARKAMIQIC
jgi:hypothetical protein